MQSLRLGGKISCQIFVVHPKMSQDVSTKSLQLDPIPRSPPSQKYENLILSQVLTIWN